MSKKLKKSISIIAIVALLLTLFSGCSSKSNSSSTTKGDEQKNTSANKNVELTLLIDNQTSTAGLNAVIDAFEKKTGIKVKLDLRPGGSEGDNVVKTRLATGSMDDLSWYNSGALFKTLNPEKYFIDLSNEPFVKNYDPLFKDAVSVNGKIYGAPTGNMSAGVWLYNKKVYSELGLQVPKTWDELLANCEKIKEAGKVPVIGSYKDCLLYTSPSPRD